jgi:hypothetical protein
VTQRRRECNELGGQEKWILGSVPETNELLGTGDLQSLADLGNSYSVVREMRVVPFGLENMARLAAATAAPLLPLTLTTSFRWKNY